MMYTENTKKNWQFPLKMPHPRNPLNPETQNPRYKFKLNHNLNLNLYREIPRNLRFSIWWISGLLLFNCKLSYTQTRHNLLWCTRKRDTICYDVHLTDTQRETSQVVCLVRVQVSRRACVTCACTCTRWCAHSAHKNWNNLYLDFFCWFRCVDKKSCWQCSRKSSLFVCVLRRDLS